MFDINKHRYEYMYGMCTMIPDVLPAELCRTLRDRVNAAIEADRVLLVNHEGQGTKKELDAGGKYLHHLFNGDTTRRELPELEGLYHGLTNVVAAVTCADVIRSPYPDSDLNIKVYPSGGGTIGWHKDTNGITCLVYLTDNSEGALAVEIERDHPAYEKPEIETKRIYAQAGSMLLMQGRKVRHCSEPTVTEQKAVIVFNYYERGDTWRPQGFDDLVYHGKPTSSDAAMKRAS